MQLIPYRNSRHKTQAYVFDTNLGISVHYMLALKPTNIALISFRVVADHMAHKETVSSYRSFFHWHR